MSKIAGSHARQRGDKGIRSFCHLISFQLDLRPLFQGTFDAPKPREDSQRREALRLRVVREKFSSASFVFGPQVGEGGKLSVGFIQHEDAIALFIIICITLYLL